MPSSFPGMNPCLEQPGVWHDFHQRFNEQYDAAGYEDYIYQTQPVPPLDTKETVWAKQFLSPAPKP